MHVGTEEVETGHVRLRKYVVTEEVQQTVPVRHEEVRVVREPITDANRDEALSGPEISEAEHEVTLHEERPVVETRAVPVERVRLETDEVTEEETVTGQVRKERIEIEGEDTGVARDPGDGLGRWPTTRRPGGIAARPPSVVPDERVQAVEGGGGAEEAGAGGAADGVQPEDVVRGGVRSQPKPPRRVVRPPSGAVRTTV